MSPADTGTIHIRGARQNNLKAIDVDIPKHRITVFTGVSGSGKSSLLFGTIAAESQRLINETYPAFVQQFMPKLGQPDADLLENISAAIVVDQQRPGGQSRSTVATVTDTAQMLRVIFSRVAEPSAGPPAAYSFNDPRGMCPDCEGTGQVASINMAAVVDEARSLAGGALLPKDFAVDGWWWEAYRNSGLFDMDKPVADFTAEERFNLLHLDDGSKVKVGKLNMTCTGVLVRLRRGLGSKNPDSLQPHARREYERIFTRTTCSVCGGARLNRQALDSRIAGLGIADMCAMQVCDLAGTIGAIDAPSIAPMVESLARRLRSLDQLGLGYLTLDRESTTLSGGESQRVKMVRYLGSSLTDIIYVFDEPSVGLHPHDVGRMAAIMRQLRDRGNTVLIVEHNPGIIAIADHIIDMGPRAGSAGGEIVYQGDFRGLAGSGTLTGTQLTRRRHPRARVRKPAGMLWISNASENNLQNITVGIPTGVLTAVTGVAGSGKSSLIRRCLPRSCPDAIIIDQSLPGGSRRSSTATSTGILDEVRKLFARECGVKPALFSSNSEGACSDCRGLGVVYTDLAHLDPVATRCETCEGKRFLPEALGHRLRGRSIADVLDMSVDEAAAFFTEKRIAATLRGLSDVGLGYLTLGQPVSTLSGGERQRLKLAAELDARGNVYILDEPTAGLHPSDTDRLIGIFDRLVDGGSTVIVIEHSPDVILAADWVIDLGPGAGRDGGRIQFEGEPSRLVDHPSSLTGEHLRRCLSGDGAAAAAAPYGI